MIGNLILFVIAYSLGAINSREELYGIDNINEFKIGKSFDNSLSDRLQNEKSEYVKN